MPEACERSIRQIRAVLHGACRLLASGATDSSPTPSKTPRCPTGHSTSSRRKSGLPQSTVLDSVISEAQKQARMGWATVQMARHYTDAITEEDRRAAQHVGDLLKH